MDLHGWWLPPTRPTPRPCSTSRRTPLRLSPSTFMWKGQHTLVVYDDLSKQAIAYRQLFAGASPAAGP